MSDYVPLPQPSRYSKLRTSTNNRRNIYVIASERYRAKKTNGKYAKHRTSSGTDNNVYRIRPGSWERHVIPGLTRGTDPRAF